MSADGHLQAPGQRWPCWSFMTTWYYKGCSSCGKSGAHMLSLLNLNLCATVKQIEWQVWRELR